MDTQNEDSIVLLPFKHNKPPSVDRYIDPGRVFLSEKSECFLRVQVRGFYSAVVFSFGGNFHLYIGQIYFFFLLIL